MNHNLNSNNRTTQFTSNPQCFGGVASRENLGTSFISMIILCFYLDLFLNYLFLYLFINFVYLFVFIYLFISLFIYLFIYLFIICMTKLLQFHWSRECNYFINYIPFCNQGQMLSFHWFIGVFEH